MAPVARLPSVPGQVPVREMVVLCLVNLNEAVQGNIIWPLLPFQVQEWGKEDIALYSGILASSFFVGQALCVASWGKAADRYGRRPTLLTGLLGTVASMLVYAFAKSFWVGAAARFAAGAMNGNVSISKTYIGEISDSVSISRAFSWFSFTWGLGTVVAPALGGLLAEPTKHIKSLADVQLFKEYPYALPSLVAVGVAVAAFTLGYFMLGETEVWLARNAARDGGGAGDSGAARRGGASAAGTGLEMSPLPRGGATPGKARASLKASVAAESSKAGGSDDAEDASLLTRKQEKGVAQPPRSGASQSSKAKAEKRVAEDVETGEGAALLSPQRVKAPPAGVSSSGAAAEDDDSAYPPLDGSTPPPSSFRDLLSDSVIFWSIGLYGILSTGQIIFDEMLPVFCKMDRSDGGLGFSASNVGVMQIVAGATQIACQLFVFPRVNLKFGCLLCYRHSIWPLAALLFFPLTGRLQSPESLWLLLSAFIALKTAGLTLAFTAIMIAINNASRGRNLGLVNGFAQAVASTVRAIGPTLGGAVFSASMAWDFLGPLRLHAIYFVTSCLFLLGFGLSWKLPKWVNRAPDYRAVTAGAAAGAAAEEEQEEDERLSFEDDDGRADTPCSDLSDGGLGLDTDVSEEEEEDADAEPQPGHPAAA